MLILALSIVGGFVGGFVWSSLFEWTLHKYVMHRPFLGLRYPFQAHALTHHRIFSWDATYEIQNMDTLDNVTFAWWNAPVLIGFNAPLMFGAAVLIAGWMTPAMWGIAASAVGAMTFYYFLYEYLHFCMHVPRDRWFQKSWVFRYIDDHHRMHHKRPNRNLNVVMPLADFLFRTKAPGLPAVSRMAAEALEAGR